MMTMMVITDMDVMMTIKVMVAQSIPFFVISPVSALQQTH